MTQSPIKVKVSDGAGPTVIIPFSQLEDVRKQLDGHGFVYWVDEYAISWNGGPQTIKIWFSRKTDAQKIQAILDSAV